MDTPPRTPPSEEEAPSFDSLQIHYCDFAYEKRGRHRLPVIDIGDVTAKTFAE